MATNHLISEAFQEVYSFEARGVAVNRPYMREGYDLAMNRCVTRFYEKLLDQ